ncbi:unnamed protein product [Danaus chrysippus]|uniref:(African queen) hypothetical protein n=1 Tax=Danaus chrysippus TaxID=151541 RepID=A0A8J2QZ76_9NEOP|nr:unnamed protein product [Danaus chrysippus]
MVSDIYFPTPPSPYQTFYPISHPLSYYHSPQRSITPKASPCNTNKLKRHDQVYDANRNHVVPYYYSETLTPCMPNNFYTPKYTNRGRHGPYDERHAQRTRLTPRLQSSSVSPELAQIFTKTNTPQSFRPYSVLENSTASPLPRIQRPTSVVPMSDNFRPASVFFRDTKLNEKSNEVQEIKSLPQKETPRPILDKSFRQICRIPNCNCNLKPMNNLPRFSESRTLPTLSSKSLDKVKNLSLPTLKLDDLNDFGRDVPEIEREIESKPVSEKHLGFV